MRKAPQARFSISALLCASTAAFVLLLASATTPAAAADLGVAPIYKAPPPAPVAIWNGSYVGVAGGGAWGSAVVNNTPAAMGMEPPEGGRFGDSHPNVRSLRRFFLPHREFPVLESLPP